MSSNHNYLPHKDVTKQIEKLDVEDDEAKWEIEKCLNSKTLQHTTHFDKSKFHEMNAHSARPSPPNYMSCCNPVYHHHAIAMNFETIQFQNCYRF